jgi:hypothetical protein
MNQKKAKIVIEKCQTLATDKGATKDERIAANRKAQDLINKHGIGDDVWVSDIWMPDAWFTPIIPTIKVVK